MSSYFIFGLQRSGTNFLQTLIERNFDKTLLNNQKVSWKHSIEDPIKYDKNLPTIVIHKNPYTWVESVCLRNKVDWQKTQRKYPSEEATTPEFTIGPRKMNLTNLVLTYKEFHENWLYREDIPSYMFIKYEDLLIPEERVKILERISEAFGWARKSNEWIIPQAGNVSQSRDYNTDREKYYIAGEPASLTREHIHEINRVMEIWPINRMGYRIL